MTLKNVKQIRTAKETTLDKLDQMEILWEEEFLFMWWTFSWKQFQFPMALFHPLFTLGTLKTATIFLDLKTCFAEDNWPRAKKSGVYMISTFINFSWCLWEQIKHVYLIEFTQVVWLLTNWWVGMNETNLTQRGRSTDVDASQVLYLRDKKKTLEKRGNLLRTASF